MRRYLKYLAAVDCDWETKSRNIYERIRSISATYKSFFKLRRKI